MADSEKLGAETPRGLTTRDVKITLERRIRALSIMGAEEREIARKTRNPQTREWAQQMAEFADVVRGDLESAVEVLQGAEAAEAALSDLKAQLASELRDRVFYEKSYRQKCDDVQRVLNETSELRATLSTEKTRTIASDRKALLYLSADIADVARGEDTPGPQPTDDHDPETCDVCAKVADRITAVIQDELRYRASGLAAPADHAVCPDCGNGWTFDFLQKRVYCRRCQETQR